MRCVRTILLSTVPMIALACAAEPSQPPPMAVARSTEPEPVPSADGAQPAYLFERDYVNDAFLHQETSYLIDREGHIWRRSAGTRRENDSLLLDTGEGVRLTATAL